MIPIAGQPILTAAQMRAAEDRAVAAGSSVSELMERAGAGVAGAVRRLVGGEGVLILCGPGNNGGDGYVAARVLREGGAKVRVAALADPRTDAAIAARSLWDGAVEDLADAASAPVLVDCLFGTGLSRGLDADVSGHLHRLADRARLKIAVDLPSGVATDDGVLLGPVPDFDVTLALGAVKPAHMLSPAAAMCGQVRLVDIGVSAESPIQVQPRPELPMPGPASHKYTRGLVMVVGGAMHGAAELAALSAYRAGAGYVTLLSGALPLPPHAIVRRRWSEDALDDARIGAVVIGTGLGRDNRAREKLGIALACPHRLVVDGDALHLIDLDRVKARAAPAILTPHEGEFRALFGAIPGSKIDRARAAAERSGAVIVYKGSDTVIAAPDGRCMVAPLGNPWLSVAGTGDVLAGAIAARFALAEADRYDAATAGVWLHGEAARLLNRCFLADELADALPLVLTRGQ